MSLIASLAWRNLRHRPGQAVLLLLTLSLSTTTLSVALAVNATANAPWERVWRQTGGAHVYADLFHPPGVPATDPKLVEAQQALAALVTAPGVAAASGPWPELFTSGEVGGIPMDLIVRTRDATPPAVDHPRVTAGSWLDSGDGVVLEDSLASTMRVRPGDTVTVTGQRLPVRGVATTVAFGRFPSHQPGGLWVNGATAERLRTAGATEFVDSVELRLTRAEDAGTFAAAHQLVDGGVQVNMSTWQQVRDNSHDELTTFTIALLVIGTLLAGLTVATAAVLVIGRLSARLRQVGTLKAVGVTPGQVASVLLVEYLAVAGAAAAIGLAVGTWLSPLVGRSVPSLYGAPQAPPITWSRAVVVGAVAIGVVLLATIRPALRGARHSTLRSLAADVRPLRRASRPARLVGWFGAPLPAVVGLRAALRRPARTVANATGLALGIAMVIVVLALDRGLDHFLATRKVSEVDDAVSGATDQVLIDQLREIVIGATALLLALAAINAATVATFAARDSARTYAIMRAVGATPRQTAVAFIVAQLGACVLACIVGIPLGVLLFATFGGDDLSPVRLSALAYGTVAVAVPLLYLPLVAVPARLLARQPVAPQLAYE